MLVRAGDIGVLACEPMHQSMLDEEVESAIDRDGCEPPALGPQHLGEIVSAERLVGRIERLENLAPDRGEPRRGGTADLLGIRHGGCCRLRLLRGAGGGSVVVVGNFQCSLCHDDVSLSGGSILFSCDVS
jgi:hypothetical protein